MCGGLFRGKCLPMFVFLFIRIFKHLMKAGTNAWWLIPWELFTHVCIFICQNIQASDEGWYQYVVPNMWELFTHVCIFICQNIQSSDEGSYQCVVAYSEGNVYPCLYFLFVRIFKHLMKAGTNVWWLIPWEMFTHLCISICQNIQASDEGWYQCVVANSVGNVSENAFIKVQGKHSLLTLNAPITTSLLFISSVECLRSLHGKQCGPRSQSVLCPLCLLQCLICQ